MINKTKPTDTGDDPEMGKTEFLGERGTSVLSIIPERNVSEETDRAIAAIPQAYSSNLEKNQ